MLTTPPPVVIVFIGLFAAGGLAAAFVRPLRNFPIAALAVVTLLTTLQVLFTVQATAGWHYFTIYPTVTIVAAGGGAVTAQSYVEVVGNDIPVTPTPDQSAPAVAPNNKPVGVAFIIG